MGEPIILLEKFQIWYFFLKSMWTEGKQTSVQIVALHFIAVTSLNFKLFASKTEDYPYFLRIKWDNTYV